MPSIVIVHPDRKTQRTVQRILGVSGYTVEIADDLEQGLEMIGRQAPALVVIDGSVASSPRVSELLAATTANETLACITLLGASASEHVPRILGLGAVTNLLVHPMPTLAEELTITTHKLIRQDLFGAEKYLLWGTELERSLVTRSGQRADLVGRLAELVRERGQSARVASMAMLVADELISNAVHNAPVDAQGEHYRKELPRDSDFELDDRHEVTVRWGCDARYLAIEVSDRFGSLDRETVLNALAKNDVRESGSGAGMGIAIVYRSCDHLVFNLAEGRRTEIIALIDVRNPPAERGAASSYNVFVERA